MRRLLAAPAALALALLAFVPATGAAYAHSNLVRAVPGPGDVAVIGLDEIVLTFGALAPAGKQQIQVLDPAGRDQVQAVTRSGDNTLTVRLTPLSAGVHLLTYEITPADGHRVKGGYYVEVVAPGGTATLARNQQLKVGAALLGTVLAVVILWMIWTRAHRGATGAPG